LTEENLVIFIIKSLNGDTIAEFIAIDNSETNLAWQAEHGFFHQQPLHEFQIGIKFRKTRQIDVDLEIESIIYGR